MKQRKGVTILIADDDEDDRLLLKEALEENASNHTIHFVEDGEELMNYLHRYGKYADLAEVALPNLILLDLNMPKKDGREALQEIKADRHLRRIPVVVLTTSQAEEDIEQSYDLGVSSFITKPVTFESLVQLMKTLGEYWFEIVELPTKQ